MHSAQQTAIFDLANMRWVSITSLGLSSTKRIFLVSKSRSLAVNINKDNLLGEANQDLPKL
jgi:hypothetical protein